MPSAQITQRKPRRMYSVDERASVLALLDSLHGNIKATAAQSGIPESSIRRIIQDVERDTRRGARVRALRAEKREELAAALTDGCWEALQQARDRLPEASSRDAAVTFGIFNQNRMTLLGMATHIHASESASVRNLTADQKRQLRDAWRAIVAGQAVTVTSPALSASSAPGSTPGDTQLSPAATPETPPGA